MTIIPWVVGLAGYNRAQPKGLVMLTSNKNYSFSTYYFTIFMLIFSMPSFSGELDGLFVLESKHKKFSQKVLSSLKARDLEVSAWWAMENKVGEQGLSANNWVTYSDDFQSRKVIDFDNEQLRLSYQGDALTNSTPDSLERDFKRLLGITLSDAYEQGEYLSFSKGTSPKYLDSLLNVDFTQNLYSTAVFERTQGLKGDVLTVMVNLPDSSLKQRADVVWPLVERATRNKNIAPALVMAIIHQESGFNPLALSREPRFGLMQLRAKELGATTGRKIFNPQYNIQKGVSILTRLSKQLASINDHETRELCVIAAYSMGVSDLARIFTGKPSIKQALPLINSLSAKQVQGQIQGALGSKDNKDFVQQVTHFVAVYDNF